MQILKVRFRTNTEFEANYQSDLMAGGLFCPTTAPLDRVRRDDLSGEATGRAASGGAITMTHTVLVVEDEQQLRDMIRDALELNGYSVVTAEDGQDALTKLAGIEHVCLVILDLLMPVMDGRTFLTKMREHAELASVPIVVHTSVPGQIVAGASMVMQKPLVFDRLLSVVREHCAE